MNNKERYEVDGALNRANNKEAKVIAGELRVPRRCLQEDYTSRVPQSPNPKDQEFSREAPKRSIQG